MVTRNPLSTRASTVWLPAAVPEYRFCRCIKSMFVAGAKRRECHSMAFGICNVCYFFSKTRSKCENLPMYPAPPVTKTAMPVLVAASSFEIEQYRGGVESSMLEGAYHGSTQWTTFVSSSNACAGCRTLK